MKTTTSASCSMPPDSRRSESIGRPPGRCSGARESWEMPITGTFSSRARIFRPRLNWLDLLDPVGSRVLGPHQLQVVDDHQPQPLLGRGQAPRLGAQLEQAQVGGVVEPQRHLLELVASPDDPRPLPRGDVALAQLVARGSAPGRR